MLVYSLIVSSLDRRCCIAGSICTCTYRHYQGLRCTCFRDEGKQQVDKSREQCIRDKLAARCLRMGKDSASTCMHVLNNWQRFTTQLGCLWCALHPTTTLGALVLYTIVPELCRRNISDARGTITSAGTRRPDQTLKYESITQMVSLWEEESSQHTYHQLYQDARCRE